MSVLRNSEVSETQGVKCITCIRDQSVPKRYVPNSAVSETQGVRKSRFHCKHEELHTLTSVNKPILAVLLFVSLMR